MEVLALRLPRIFPAASDHPTGQDFHRSIFSDWWPKIVAAGRDLTSANPSTANKGLETGRNPQPLKPKDHVERLRRSIFHERGGDDGVIAESVPKRTLSSVEELGARIA